MEKQSHFQDPAKWVEDMILDFANRPEENTLKNGKNEKAWEDPLVGFSSGDDPLYQAYKEVVGSFHWTPAEAFSQAFPSSKVPLENLTVISWVLPQTRTTKSENRKETLYPSERWARARIFGEEFNVNLAKHVVMSLQEAGVEAVAPSLSPSFTWMPSERYTLASMWSERHAAYASGLGTFGLCDGMITSKGKAVRFGSVVANIKIPPTKRPYEDPRAYCLFFSKGTCGKCIKRCPVGALTSDGHDKVKCRAHIDSSRPYVKSKFGFEGYGCGLCQTGVPCESRIPLRRV